MKHLFSALLAVAMIPLTYWAQTPPLASSSFSTEAPTGYWLEIETVTAHTGGALDGMTTYRVYLNTINATDYLSSCSGEQANPGVQLVFWIMVQRSGGTTWNALGINSAFLTFFPDLAYDSFLTIGAEDASVPAAQHPSSVWGAFDATSEFTGGPGSSFVVNDATGGAWYTPFPGVAAAATHAGFAGDDLRILVAQFTTEGTMSGQ